MKIYKFRDVEKCISVLFLIFAGFCVNKLFITKGIFFLDTNPKDSITFFVLNVDEKCMLEASFHVNDVDPLVASENKMSVNQHNSFEFY